VSLTIDGRRISRLQVVGYGVTGRAVTRFAVARGVRVFVTDRRALASVECAELRRWGVDFEDGGHSDRGVRSTELVVLSPGIPPDHPVAASARDRGLPVLSEIDLAIASVPLPAIIAVTGTDGKSTTTALIGALLRTVGASVEIAGNIGVPLIAVAERSVGCDAIVLEVSSYQLEQTQRLHPRVAVLLNVAPDHLDRHRSTAAYRAAKARIFQNQGREDAAVLPSDLAAEFPGGSAVRWLYDSPRPELPMWANGLSPHNRQNLRAALTAVFAFGREIDLGGLRIDAVDRALHLPHRMQEIGSIRGIRIIDDSKATNPHATTAALRALDAPVVLLLGGRYKEGGYDDLASELSRRELRSVIVFGEAAPLLTQRLSAAGVPYRRTGRMADAVADALRVARPGDILLLSPACSSFDEFAGFSQRGDAFARQIRAEQGFVPP